MGLAPEMRRWAWRYVVVVIALVAVVPVIPLGALGGIGSRLHFALMLPLALGAVSAVSAYRHPALATAWFVPALAVAANGASAVAYGAGGVFEIILTTLVLNGVGMVCGAGWKRFGE